MTERDWYGLAALAGLLAAGKTGSHRSLATQAWAYADALPPGSPDPRG